ncbi:transposase [Marinobacterium sp. D7]|uniref:transposase n=1 Tax=Marinobacterium ramblicola TaxID=2849041 RepID=UPI001C2D387D|nr:transposase [Marinobacterium ramblicola]MBV1787106.1 transposase [Marinobacterium ramblicola]
MTRRPRICPEGIPQHIIQRGNNRQVCFTKDDDYATYAQWLAEASERYEVQIHAWVFMTNHVHLLATPLKEGALSSMMQHLGRRYVRYFNNMYQRTGTLWEGRFKSCLVHSEHYLLICQRYIEMNPVKAGMVRHPSQYHWSSYHAHAQGVDAALWTPHDQYLSLGKNKTERQKTYRELFETSLPEEQVQHIRLSVNQGLPLGNDRFRDEIERLTGIRQQPLKPGRKKARE